VEGLDEHDSKGEDVGLRALRRRAVHLGGEVGEGPHHQARGGQGVALLPTPEPEVPEDGAALLVQEDVPGLHVAVDDPGCVQRGEGATDPGRQVPGLRDRERASPQPCRQVPSLDQSGHDVGWLGIEIRVENLHQGRVAHVSEGHDLSGGAGQGLAGTGPHGVRVQDLDRHQAAVGFTLGLEDASLGALSEQGEGLVAGDGHHVRCGFRYSSCAG
jgi:hypothetical protein